MLGEKDALPMFDGRTVTITDFRETTPLLDIPILVTASDPDAPEKFQDPLYECFGTGPDRGIEYRWLAWHRDTMFDGALTSGTFYLDGDYVEAQTTLGYEYLSGVPNIPRDRIRAIRNRINEYVASNPTPPLNSNASMGQPLDMLRYASWENLEKVATNIYDRYADAEKIVDSVPGMSWERAEALAAQISSNYEGSDQIAARYQTIRTAARDIAPVAIALSKAVQQAIGIASGELSDEERANLGFHVAADVIALVPVYGPIVAAAMNFVIGFWDSSIARERAQSDEYARVSGEMLGDIMRKTSAKGVPIPFHATDMWWVGFKDSAKTTVGPTYYAPSGFRGSPWQWELYQNLLYNFDVFNGEVKGGTGNEASEGSGLTAPQVDAVKRWWATAVMFMSDPAVYDTFRALGWDALGGTIASDEQVMLVAAPIAASRGLDVDKFAMALHARSLGWRGEVAANRGVVRSRRRSYWSPDTEWSLWGKNEARRTSGERPEDPIKNMPLLSREWSYCNDASRMPVANAWWLNLAALARDAFALADGDPAKGEPPFGEVEKDVPPLREPPSALVTVGLPAAAGVAAGFVFGGPIGIAVGLGSWLLSSWLTSD